MMSTIDQALRTSIGLIRAARHATKLLALIAVSMIGLVSAQGAVDQDSDETELTERAVAYRHYF